MTTTSTDRLVGRLLDGRYLLGQVLAHGGMGTVMLATDTRLERTVAVKVMQNDVGGDADFTARLRTEARAAARLSHPNVVAVYDQGDDDGLLYLVMEYVPGRTLRDVVADEAPLPPRRALALIEPLLMALSAAHDARMIHRDVKPENVLISPDGQVKVADFGLARAITARSQATTGVLIGSVSYLAPELVLNEGADARCDVYAVGAVLYELLTGRKPHTGETPIQVAYQHVHADVAPPSQSVAGIPPYVDALVARACARDRDHRSADARVLLHQVRRVRSALEANLPDDPDLTDDLRLHHVAATGTEDPPPVAVATATLAAERAADAGLGALDVTAAAGPGGYEATSATGYEATRAVTAVPSGPPPADPGPPGSSAAGPPRSPADGSGSASPGAATRNERARRRGRALLILAVVLALGAAAFGWWFGVARYDSAPDLVGLSMKEARAAAADQGFAVEMVGSEFSETASKGTVSSSEPAPGDRLLPDSTIELLVSKGKERYPLPDLTGMTEQDAEEALDEVKAVPGTVERRFSTKVDDGLVIRTALDPGTQVRPGTEVDMVVSKGPKPVDVKDYTGKSADKATGKLEKAGLEVEVATEYSEDVEAGDVISQDPPAGRVFEGDTITLTVSDGPEPIEVPGVVGRNVDDARQILEDAGFEVEVEKERIHFGSNLVSRQSPGGGDLAQPGDTILLRIV
ncbi:serine/threonine-protein kinase [Mumia flava]|uniref:non-specific serine/threonine protein kinase n=1 Tax=Mumia flava TaxID=1348852 RepID=A0A0B2B2U9_9ACTN|nr:Stk1 family PASTA domain-containing Ser/Thr kinase [Mumia flava]PJJ56046.1 serine/threonine-protein kinase [Mumia flava]